MSLIHSPNMTSTIAGFRKQTWISIVICGLLLATYVATRDRYQQAGQEPLILATVSTDEISEIEVKGAQNIDFKKVDSQWRVVQEGKTLPSDSGGIEEALSNLLSLNPGRLISRRTEKHADYEVDKEKGRHITLKNGTQVVRDIILGSRSKSGGTYIRMQGSDKVYVAEGQLGNVFSKSANEYRQKKLNIDFGEIYSIKASSFELSQSGESLDMKPFGQTQAIQLDDDKIRTFIDNLKNVRAKTFVQKSDIEATKKLSDIKLVNKDNKERTLKFYQQGDKYFALVEPFAYDYGFELAKHEMEKVNKFYHDFEDLHLIKNKEATRIEISGNAQPLVLEKSESGWNISDTTKIPAGYDLDLSRAVNLAKDILNLEATKNNWDVNKYGQVIEKIRLTIGDEVVKFGALIQDDDELNDHRIAVVESRGKMYAIPSYKMGIVTKPFDRLKKVAPPPQGMGGMQGLQGLPPELQQQLMKAMQQQGM